MKRSLTLFLLSVALLFACGKKPEQTTSSDTRTCRVCEERARKVLNAEKHDSGLLGIRTMQKTRKVPRGEATLYNHKGELVLRMQLQTDTDIRVLEGYRILYREDDKRHAAQK